MDDRLIVIVKGTRIYPYSMNTGKMMSINTEGANMAVMS